MKTSEKLHIKALFVLACAGLLISCDNSAPSSSTSSSDEPIESTSSSSSNSDPSPSSSQGGSIAHVVPTYQGMTVSRSGPNAGKRASFEESYSESSSEEDPIQSSESSEASSSEESSYEELSSRESSEQSESSSDSVSSESEESSSESEESSSASSESSSEEPPVPEQDEHQEHDDDIEKDIDDIVQIDVETDEQVKYYVKPNETFIIEVHISNPNDYEIQSFTLNGKKYANYMFKDGSTMELLLLETTAPAESGYYDYTIDAIKYIDGTEIKDVDMSKGDKSIRTGVAYTVAPSAEVKAYQVSTTYAEMSITIKDPQSLIGDNPISLYLSDGEKAKEVQSLKVGQNDIRFEGLATNTTYQYGIVTAYDFVDGKDLHPEWILVNEFTTLSAYVLSSINVGKTDISFDIARQGEVGAIDSISLYDAATNELVRKGDSSTRSFGNLLSNHTYNLYVDYSYVSGGQELSDYLSGKGLQTTAKVSPRVSFASSSADKASVSYEISIEDVDEILSVSKVELLKNGQVVKDNGTALKGQFNDLLSNNNYSVKISYVYDLNDGQGPINGSVIKEVKTEAKVAPKVSFLSVSADKTSISYDIATKDDDEVLKISKVELIKGDQAVKDNGKTLTGSFEGLLSNNKYSVKVSYSYDLNDGKGVIEDSISKELSTVAKAVPSIELSSPTADKTSVSYSISLTDEDGVAGISKVELLKDGEAIKDNGSALTGSFTGLLSNNKYSVKVSYTYDLNDGNGLINDSIVKSIKTVAKVSPTLAFTSSSSDKTSVSYEVSTEDDEGILSISKVELLKDGVAVKDNGTSLTGTFSDLLSNNAYSVKVSYTYDLNDGRGALSDFIEKEVATLAKVTPTVALSNDTVTDTTIEADIEATDEDSVGYIESVKLYKGDELVATNDSKVVSFGELDYYTDYRVEVVYGYDLNDGKGVQTVKAMKEYKTSPHMEFKSCKVINTSSVSEGDTIYVQVSLDNPLGALPSSVVINGQTYTCGSSTTTSRIYIEIPNNGQFEGGNTTLTVEKVNMVLDGVDYSIKPSANNGASVYINGKIEALDMEFTQNGKNIMWAKKGDAFDLHISLSNKTGYQISSLTVSGNAITEFDVVDANNIYIRNYNERFGGAYGSLCCALSSLAYSNEYISSELTGINLSSRLYVYKDAEVGTIASSQDFATLEDGRYYELTNDIDFTGVSWQPHDFQGVINGKGYAIENLNFVDTVKNASLDFGLFGNVNGVISDLKFSDCVVLATLDSTNEASYYASVGILGTYVNGRVVDCEFSDISIQITNALGETNAGIITNSNSGVIERCSVKTCDIRLIGYKQYFGGVASSNFGIIQNCDVDITASNETTYYTSTLMHGCPGVGGVTALNSSEGYVLNNHVKFDFSGVNSSSECKLVFIGGVVGSNVGYVTYNTSEGKLGNGAFYRGTIQGSTWNQGLVSYNYSFSSGPIGGYYSPSDIKDNYSIDTMTYEEFLALIAEVKKS